MAFFGASRVMLLPPAACRRALALAAPHVSPSAATCASMCPALSMRAFSTTPLLQKHSAYQAPASRLPANALSPISKVVGSTYHIIDVYSGISYSKIYRDAR